MLHLPGSPGLDSTALRRTERQAAHGQLHQRTAQCKWRPARVGPVGELKAHDRALIGCCVNCRCWGRTVCVSASVTEACFLFFLTCLEPKRYLNHMGTSCMMPPFISFICPFILLASAQVYSLENSRMSKQVIEQVNSPTSPLRKVMWSLSCLHFSGADAPHFSLQLMEANLMKGGVELLEVRPEQLTSSDLGEQQVLWNKTWVPLGGVRNRL